jgi:hypothetical protein
MHGSFSSNLNKHCLTKILTAAGSRSNRFDASLDGYRRGNAVARIENLIFTMRDECAAMCALRPLSAAP